jgi:pantoate--beta-alanine ligase
LLALPTQREANGLAMSSRNGFLDKAQRDTATIIQQSLETVAAALRAGGRDFAALEAAAAAAITAAGLRPDYVAIREAQDLAVPRKRARHLVVLAAAYLGEVRLIDNVIVELSA